MKQKISRKLKELMALYDGRKHAIRQRLSDFSSVPASEYFYELLYCLMTPQSSAEHAEQAVQALQRAEFYTVDINPESLLRIKEHYIRFHRTKAQHLMKVKQDYDSILQALSNGLSSFELREWLVSHVLGLGYKEATHFLRNIGKNNGLAILDRHILRNLKRFGVIRSIPKSLSRKKYLTIETKFAAFAHNIGIPVDDLDLLFWSMETGEIRK